MTDSNYNGMFRVSPEKRKFLDVKTGISTEKGFHEKCQYDMHNFAIYDMDGNFIEEGKQIEYNSCFLVTILHLKIIDVKGFFNYHYDFTPDKETYLDYLEFGILNHKSLDKGTRDFFQKLIDEKRKELSEHSIKLKDTITQFLKDDLINNYKEWKQKLKNPLATELQFLEIEKTKCENAISKSKVMNDKLFHGEPSILLYKETNELTKLKIINERIIELSEPQQSTNETKSNESTEPKNPFKKIFINGFSFELFERLRDEIIVNPNHNYADYSFIMCQMINDEFLHETNHIKLIKFLDQNYNTTIGIKYNQFKFADTITKKRAYSKLKKEFKPKINSIL